MPTLAELRSGFDLGDWVVLPAKGVLRLGDKEIRPEPRVFDVLLALAQRDGDVVSKDELIAEVWGGRIISDSTLSARIAVVRKAIGVKGMTLKGLG